MAVNRLFMQLPKREIKNKPAEFPFYEGNELVGTFRLSRGGIQFVRKGCTYGAGVTLKRAAELLLENQSLKGRTGGKRVTRGRRPKGDSPALLAG